MALTQAYVSDSGGGGGSLAVQEEGSTTTAAAATLNFVGAGVTATDVAGVATVTIPGGGTPAEVLITRTVLGASAATFSFSSISGSYKDLRIVLAGRGTTAATFCRPRIQFNGDTGNNYEWQRSLGHSTSSGAEGGGTVGGTGVAFIDVGLLPASTGPSNAQGAVEARIINYTGTTFHKPLVCNAIGQALGERYALTGGGLWRSTSAITSITLILDAGNYDVGSVASLYGIL